MEAPRTSETLVNFYQTTRHYNPEDSHLHNSFPNFLSTDISFTLLHPQIPHMSVSVLWPVIFFHGQFVKFFNPKVYIHCTYFTQTLSVFWRCGVIISYNANKETKNTC
jgi:hypothetical protein